jgi:hypothetical protein
MIAARPGRAPRARSPLAPDRRRPATVAFYLFAAAVLLPAYMWLAPASRWSDPVLIVALGLIAIFARSSEVALKVGAPGHLDATMTLALLALLVGGPLPALVVACCGEVITTVATRPRAALSLGVLSSLISFAAGVLAAAWVLSLAGSGGIGHRSPVLFLAGFSYITVNFAVARMVFGVLWQGFPAARVAREFQDALPAILAMLLLAVATGLALAAVGIWGLVLIAPVALLPAFAAAVRAWSFRTLSRPRIAALYATSITAAMGMGRRERRQAALATRVFLAGGPVAGAGHHLRVLAWHATERWDGSGTPGGLAGRHIPRASRVVAVAAEWARLTAADGAHLTHVQALLDLELRSGTEFDPEVVRAAAELIAEEQAFADAPGHALPVLHTWPLPAAARRAVGRALRSCAAAG